MKRFGGNQPPPPAMGPGHGMPPGMDPRQLAMQKQQQEQLNAILATKKPLKCPKCGGTRFFPATVALLFYDRVKILNRMVDVLSIGQSNKGPMRCLNCLEAVNIQKVIADDIGGEAPEDEKSAADENASERTQTPPEATDPPDTHGDENRDEGDS